jgi:signal transduction histidine kinase
MRPDQRPVSKTGASGEHCVQTNRRQPEAEQTTAHYEPETAFASETQLPSNPPVSLESSNHRQIVDRPRPLPSPAAPNLTTANPAQTLASLIHDTRNMVSAIDLYCDLLAEPEVLSARFLHYAGELRLIGVTCRRLLARMAALGSTTEPEAHSQPVNLLPPQEVLANNHPDLANPATIPAVSSASNSANGRIVFEGQPVENLAEELLANQNLLSALAGPGIALSMAISEGHSPISMTNEDLTRVLVNLVRNAAEAMPRGGRIQIKLREEAGFLSLSIADSGTGIPKDSLEKIFLAGYSTHSISSHRLDSDSGPDGWPVRHRGLGLSIVRSIVSAAGGTVRAFNRMDDPAIADSQRKSPKTHATPPGPLDGNSELPGAVILIEFPRHEFPMTPS